MTTRPKRTSDGYYPRPHPLKEITRSDAVVKRFGPCILEADIDVRGDGVYINVRDYSLG